MKIEIEGLKKSFAGQTVLDGLRLSGDFETLAVIGPSGGGKSTFLRIIGGLLLPDSGRIVIDGAPLPADEGGLTSYRRGIGFVFQQGGLFPHMAAAENISLPLVKVHGFSQQEADARTDELLRRFGIAGEAKKRPSQLSGGQQQRVAIARAVAPRPRFVLLDEPTSALDPEYTIEVLDMVRELAEGGMDMIIVTHEIGFARHACKSAAFLANGRLLEYGGSEELFAKPETPELKAFLGKLLEWNV